MASQNNPRRGWVKGQPVKYIVGHVLTRRFADEMRIYGRLLEPHERVFNNCVRVGACLVWQGKSKRHGYACISIGECKTEYVHRIAYQYYYGAIPDGLVIDHVKARGCTSRLCCEPSHLEAVTSAENTLRGDGPTAGNARKSKCERGHELSGDNLVPSQLARYNQRTCRTCHAQKQRENRALKRKGATRVVEMQ